MHVAVTRFIRLRACFGGLGAILAVAVGCYEIVPIEPGGSSSSDGTGGATSTSTSSAASTSTSTSSAASTSTATATATSSATSTSTTVSGSSSSAMIHLPVETCSSLGSPGRCIAGDHLAIWWSAQDDDWRDCGMQPLGGLNPDTCYVNTCDGAICAPHECSDGDSDQDDAYCDPAASTLLRTPCTQLIGDCVNNVAFGPGPTGVDCTFLECGAGTCMRAAQPDMPSFCVGP